MWERQRCRVAITSVLENAEIKLGTFFQLRTIFPGLSNSLLSNFIGVYAMTIILERDRCLQSAVKECMGVGREWQGKLALPGF